ncbi:MAG: TonB family protein, partial [Bacteroidota bacterium]
DFYQEEIAKKVEYYGNMAQVIASYYLVYNKYGSKVQFEDRGVVSFQLIYDQQRWWIANLIWNSELDDEPIPDEFLGLAPPPAINPPASTTNATNANTSEPPAKKAAKPFPMDQVEKLPAYPGGPSAMMEFLETRSALPPDMRAAGIKGKVKVRFVVTKAGKLSNVEVVEAAHPKLGDQARRILEDMPPWQPGTVGDQPVDVQYLPITLTLE